MKTGLEHLPPTKRRELELVVEILFAEFQDAIRSAAGLPAFNLRIARAGRAARLAPRSPDAHPSNGPP